MKNLTAFFIFCVISVLLSANLYSEIIETKPDLVLVDPAPASVLKDEAENSVTIIAFNEKQQITVDKDINVNISVPGVVNNLNDFTPATIKAGRLISSHFIHFDPIDPTASADGSDTVSLRGSATFDNDILGIIFIPKDLDESAEVLGLPDVIYPKGTEILNNFTSNETIAINTNSRSVAVQFSAGTDFDQIRVITKGTPGELLTELNLIDAEVVYKNEDKKDSFVLKGDLLPGKDSDGFSFEDEEVSIQVGEASVKIPIGTFVKDNSGVITLVGGTDNENKPNIINVFKAEGTFNGVIFNIVFNELETGLFSFDIDVKDINLVGIVSPLVTRIRIGNELWGTSVKLEGELNFTPN